MEEPQRAFGRTWERAEHGIYGCRKSLIKKRELLPSGRMQVRKAEQVGFKLQRPHCRRSPKSFKAKMGYNEACGPSHDCIHDQIETVIQRWRYEFDEKIKCDTTE